MITVYLRSPALSVQTSLIDLLSPLSSQYEHIDQNTLRFYMSSEAYVQAKLLIPTLQEDLGESFVALGGFDSIELMSQALRSAESYAQNQLIDLSDLLLIGVMHQDTHLVTLIHQMIEKLPHTLIETAKMMVLCSGHSQRAASLLYLHRNTFLYRLNQFFDQTGIDLREAHHLDVFKSYFLLSERQLF